MPDTKSVLIISPYFPPSNAADMQRIRMSLPYFREFGWEAEIVTVNAAHSDIVKDDLLMESVPANVKIHRVSALPKSWTSKIGLGSVALRSLPFYRSKVNLLLKEKSFDLIYFSTTQFPVCILGAYWKKKFKIPYIIDMQDPWHSDYYQDKPRAEQPPKYWLSYRLNKLLEPIAMRSVDGLISVSDVYIKTLKQRYPVIRDIPSKTITFGAFDKDFEIVKANLGLLKPAFNPDKEFLHLLYIGRGGNDMHKALSILFRAFKKGLTEEKDLFNRFKLHFIGTSYAPQGMGKKTILPVALEYGLANYVVEETDRVPFYEGLASLQLADGLIIPGSDDAGYTASKIYPYILTKKPLLGLFHPKSSAAAIIRECHAGEILTLESVPDEAYKTLTSFLQSVINKISPNTLWDNFMPYTAKEMTRKQVELFNQVLDEQN